MLRVEVGGSRSNAVSAIYTNFRLDGTTYTLRYGAFVGGQAGEAFHEWCVVVVHELFMMMMVVIVNITKDDTRVT